MPNKLPSPPKDTAWIVDNTGSEPSICLVDRLSLLNVLCFPASQLESESVMADVEKQVEQMKEKDLYINSLKQIVEEANNG